MAENMLVKLNAAKNGQRGIRDGLILPLSLFSLFSLFNLCALSGIAAR